MAAANDDASVVIIKKVKKGGHGGHHGGAWKVAYADFVTAMMAFFLLLWLLNATTEEQRRGIADYFSPSSVSLSTSGSDGVLGGLTLTKEGAMRSQSSPVGITTSLPADEESEDNGEVGAAARESDPDGDRDNKGEKPTEAADATGSKPNEASAEQTADAQVDPPAPPQAAGIDAQQIDDLVAAREQAEFEAAAEKLRQAIEAIPELQELSKQLIIDQTQEGMRIQLVDQHGRSMFPSGSAKMHDHTKQLLKLVAEAIKPLTKRIAIKGHTDATPYRTESGYSNWELSTDRANASRRALIEAGLNPNRFESVIGRAAQDPLLPDNPTSPRNRRISIILIRDANSGPVREEPNFQSGASQSG